MKNEREPRLSAPMRSAVAELEGLVRQQFPEATFRVRRSLDEDHGINLMATVDIDDPDAVMDLVVERVTELQIDQDLPIHVVPVRTPARRARLLQEQSGQKTPALQPVDILANQA